MRRLNRAAEHQSRAAADVPKHQSIEKSFLVELTQRSYMVVDVGSPAEHKAAIAAVGRKVMTGTDLSSVRRFMGGIVAVSA